MEILDEKTSIVRPPEINERSIKTNIQPPYTNELSFDMNVHKISDVPANFNTKHDLYGLNSKFSNLDINSTTELTSFSENKNEKLDESDKE